MKIINIEPGGRSWTIGDMPDWAATGGRITVRRVSYIWPVRPVKRLAFRLLRLLFGSRGKVAEWTRGWRGPWEVIVLGSTKRFLHPSRRVCVAWEINTLEQDL